MSRTRHDADEVVRAWLEDGVTVIPDRIIDGVLEQLPAVPQRARERRWIRIVGAAAGLLLVAVGLALVVRSQIGDEPAAAWQRFPTRPVESFTAGPYLIGDPFPVRIGLTVPEGWETGGLRPTLAQIGSPGGGLDFTVVDGVYTDPCHLEAGLVDPPVGPSADDLASALAALPGVEVAGPTDTIVDGHRAVTMTLTGPPSLASCTAPDDGGPKFRIWGAPEWHWLDANERNRIWIVEVPGTRLVISAEELPDATPRFLAELNETIASIDLEPSTETAVVDGSPEPTPSFPELPASGPLPAGDYQYSIRLHRYTTGGTAIPLSEPQRGIVTVPRGWSASGTGVLGPAGMRVALGSVATVYLDPCRWRTSALGTADPPLMRTLGGLSEALSGWWVPDATPSVDYEPPPFAPMTTEAIDVPRYGQFGRYVELTVPEDVNLADCDGGEYRIWEDLNGNARVARAPGELIRIWIVDYEPGLLVVDASVLAGTSSDDVAELDELLPTLWVFPLDQSPASSPQD